MDWTRRDLFLLAAGLSGFKLRGEEKPSLPSKAFRYEDLPARASGKNSFRAILSGKTHSGFPIELHESELAPEQSPHPPHHHRHEEIFLIREGTVEVTMGGESSRLGPGSAAFVASNAEHGIRNVGTGFAKYFVFALGEET